MIPGSSSHNEGGSDGADGYRIPDQGGAAEEGIAPFKSAIIEGHQEKRIN